MHPTTHGLLGWLIANLPGVDRRGRIAITAAAVAPDLDGLGAPVEWLTRTWERPLTWYTDYHHVLCHNLSAACVCAAIVWAWTRSGRVAALAFAAFVLHLLCDVAGSRGPDGHAWPLPLLAPFSAWEWTWSGQWALNAWQNVVVTIVAEAAALWLAWRRGFSPVELCSRRADAHVVAFVRRIVPPRGAAPQQAS